MLASLMFGLFTRSIQCLKCSMAFYCLACTVQLINKGATADNNAGLFYYENKHSRLRAIVASGF